MSSSMQQLTESQLNHITEPDIFDESQYFLSYPSFNDCATPNRQQQQPHYSLNDTVARLDSSISTTPVTSLVINRNTTNTQPKIKRSYTLQQKMDVIDIYDSNYGDMDKILNLSNVSQRLIKEWVKNRKKIEESRSKSSKRRLDGGGRKPLSPELDRLVSYFIEKMLISINNLFIF